jgi:predicted phosphodiesterase
MRYAIISDIHANPAALEKVLADSARYGVEKIVCAGDLVGYGPDPTRVVRIVRECGIVAVMGNHDAAVVGLRSIDGMIGHALDASMRHRAELSKDDLDWLGSLPYVYEDGVIAVAHANFENPVAMGYVNDRLDAQRSFFRREERMLFVGHTHVEALYAFGFDSDPRFPDCKAHEPSDFKAVDGWRYLINVGSVGYPRARPYSTYALYNSETGDILFRNLEFDFEGYKAALRAKSIPVPGWM